MSARDTGGPARFMSLRDYFIAHAPSHAPKWFFPVMPPCPVVPSAMNVLAGSLYDDLRSWRLGRERLEDLSEEAQLWLSRRDEAEAAQEEWQAEFRRQCYAQWPCAWADLMLEQRAK